MAAAMRIESPGRRTLTRESLMLSSPVLIFHSVGFDGVVSLRAVSLSSTLMSDLLRFSRSTSAVERPRSMPWLRMMSRPTRPLICVSLMRSIVLSLLSYISRPSTSMRDLSSGSSATLTLTQRESSTVSLFWRAKAPMSVRSRGKARRTRSTRTVMPVCDDA